MRQSLSREISTSKVIYTLGHVILWAMALFAFNNEYILRFLMRTLWPDTLFSLTILILTVLLLIAENHLKTAPFFARPLKGRGIAIGCFALGLLAYIALIAYVAALVYLGFPDSLILNRVLFNSAEFCLLAAWAINVLFCRHTGWKAAIIPAVCALILMELVVGKDRAMFPFLLGMSSPYEGF